MKTYKHIVGKSRITKGRFSVAIFGSARIKHDKLLYKKVYGLAKLLAERNYDIVTGGGPGLMEAANAGHKAGNKGNYSRSVGLGVKLPREQGYNKNLDKTETFVRFTGRLDRFMLLSNAVVVASGGVGTLLELFYTWQLVQVRKKKDIPIILLGPMWPGLLRWLRHQPLRKKYFTKDDYNMLVFAKDERHAIKIIDEAYKDFMRKKK